MEREALIRVAEFYSRGADYPLAGLKPGSTVVFGSDRRYPGKGNGALYMGILGDACLISTQHELVAEMQRIADMITSPEQFMLDEVRRQILEVCLRSLGDQAVCYTYAGVKLCCDRSTYTQVVDDNVRRITRMNAGEVITHLLDDDIPTDVNYLLADDAAFAYYADGRPVAYAGTHPVGDWSDRIGNVLVGTHKDYRRRGYGKAVVSATTGRLIEQGRVAVYGTSDDNIASQRTAQSVGFDIFCHVFEVRFANS